MFHAPKRLLSQIELAVHRALFFFLQTTFIEKNWNIGTITWDILCTVHSDVVYTSHAVPKTGFQNWNSLEQLGTAWNSHLITQHEKYSSLV
jgi:hypothetical protein